MSILHVKSPNSTQTDLDLSKIVLTDTNQTITGLKTFNHKFKLANLGEVGRMLTGHDGDTSSLKQLYFSTTVLEHWVSDGGAKLALHAYEEDNKDRANGAFSFLASDGSNKYNLYGYPNGNLVWNRYDTVGLDIGIRGINTDDTGYIRYGNGIQICWGGGGPFDFPLHFSYAMPFINLPSIGINNGDFSVGNWDYTGVNINRIGGDGSYVKYMAIGRWK